MCGIVGAVAQRDVGEILLEGLRRLEYRGYDSAGIAIIDHKQKLHRLRALGKVAKLCEQYKKAPILGHTGIAHTRWATHGIPSEINAHPHQSGEDLALVHNGIIENYEELQGKLKKAGYKFKSKTDTETIVHLIHRELRKTKDLLQAVKKATKLLKGAFALGIISQKEPDRLIAIRSGSPLVVGLGIGENFIASDTLALLPVTQKFIFLEEGDIADITRDGVKVYNEDDKMVKRKIYASELDQDTATRGKYRHFMQKEIFEQANALKSTLDGRVSNKHVLVESFGMKAAKIFARTKQVQIVACGTSYNAGMVARYWFEEMAGISCQVEIASEFRYRKHVVQPNTLLVTISQSGETADTLAALRVAKKSGYLSTLAICNVPESSLVRESDLVFMTRAGREIGVASTKAFTTQLLSLLMLAIVFSQDKANEREQIKRIKLLKSIPGKVMEVLELNDRIKRLAKLFTDKYHALFLGRGKEYPIAMEGALKLKEISYLHAEAYPAGELKHGPLALVDKDMPVIAVAPNDELLEKLKSNLEEVNARGGQLIVFADAKVQFKNTDGIINISMPPVNSLIAPIIYTIPLQLLAYHVALIKGTDVDQPRNLAKSVTVE
jgi:glutamine---fructose-6-phosphate transaminase (isomerizing)